MGLIILCTLHFSIHVWRVYGRYGTIPSYFCEFHLRNRLSYYATVYSDQASDCTKLLLDSTMSRLSSCGGPKYEVL
ncbi:hypothetical protein BDP27DRAFT_1339544 [Rhodocollybia butyracea]|uniref:Secreted protein n=1 Tax=Rhodocollybia butyracea TaxID=206335 RepID=A0A9P5PBP7_9AGAR|nr:hypothetical protein BDP27DRAFT_1339544 [Rhodocollybia butyracea]